jgi:SAM-dependent methyltransferase
VFGGRRDWRRPFRALIAGGGTGDAAIMLAQQLKDEGCPAEIVHLDLSEAAQGIARARAAARGLAVRFVRGSLMELDRIGLGAFDYIDCCGVLHHLADPDAGLSQLARALAPEGGFGAMVYAPYGRTGVYPAQALLRTLTAGETPAEKVRVARLAVAALPSTNWLTRNEHVSDHRSGDAGLYDLLLNPRDRPFTVGEVAGLVTRAGLRLTGLIEPLRYRPESYIADPALLARLAPLSDLERAAFAEQWSGNMRRHTFYAVRADNAADLPARPVSPDLVPAPCGIDPASLARGIAQGQALKAAFDGIALRIAIPPAAAPVAALIDGRRTLEEIRVALATPGHPAPDWLALLGLFEPLYRALNGLNLLFLRSRRD